MNQDDQQFWDRLADMPFLEQEQECVLRREHVTLQMAVLREAREDALMANRKAEASQIGVAMFQDMASLTRINERIKYLRKVQDQISWRETVRTVLGDEALEKCVAWRIQQEIALKPRDAAPRFGRHHKPRMKT